MSGTIVTFYSYKGGVGRSAAVANVAVLLARAGKRVLVVDWDLEAPGLEPYFAYFNAYPRGDGLLGLLGVLGERDAATLHEESAWEVRVGSDEWFDFIPSEGTDRDEYVTQLSELDWDELFHRGVGDKLEELRQIWKQHYDLVLIDSRTGLSDSGGVCTVLMPDVIVAMFTANEQGVSGVSEVVKRAHAARQQLAYDRMQLTVVPVLSRLPGSSEFVESEEWMDRAATAFEGLCDDWLPQSLDTRSVISTLRLPQVDFFSFGEKLAVVEQPNDPSSLSGAYQRIAQLLASDFQSLEDVFGPRSWWVSSSEKPKRPQVGRDEQIDVFLSYVREGIIATWVDGFVLDLEREVGRRLKGGLTIAPREDSSFSSWTTADDEIRRALLIVPIVTPSYMRSEWCRWEWDQFARAEALDSGTSRIYPLLLRGIDPGLLPGLKEREYIDGRHLDLSTRRSSAGSLEYQNVVEKLAQDLIKALRKRPAPLSDVLPPDTDDPVTTDF